MDAETFAVAEKLVQVEMTPKDRAEAAGNWQQSMAAVVERRVGPRKLAIGYGDVPATVWKPEMRRMIHPESMPLRNDSLTSEPEQPKADEDIAYAPVAWLSGWILRKELTSERLTRIYLERLKSISQC